MVVRVLALLALLVVASPASAQEDMKRAEDCQARMLKLNEIGLLRDLKAEPGALRMVVDLKLWNELDFGGKTKMAELAACMATLGDAKKSARVNVYDHMNNRVVGRYNGAKLEIP